MGEGTAPGALAGGGANLSGPRKAAVLLVALGQERAAEILGRLSGEEAEALSMEIARVPKVETETVQVVLREAIDGVLALQHLAEGGLEYARATLERSVGPERAREILERLTARLEKRPFEFLQRTPAEHIAAFLSAESPQTVALVIAHLPATQAAGVLALLHDSEQADIARRVARLADLAPAVPRTIEGVVRQRLSAVIAQGSSTAGGTGALAQMLTSAGRTTERQVLDQLARTDPALAAEVRDLMFTFEDIARLDDRAIQLVLRELEPKDLPVALRGAGETVRERILENMSQRGAEMVREEIAYMPPQRRSVIEDAQGRIVAVIRRLEDSDAITLGREGSDELL